MRMTLFALRWSIVKGDHINLQSLKIHRHFFRDGFLASIAKSENKLLKSCFKKKICKM